ncbi:MAG TPA: allantoicase [Pseudonocardiaceae bacterium]
MTTTLPDLAVRTLGGAVIAANDEFFADKENLIRPEAPVFSPQTFNVKGQVYDGWETRRRRTEGHDFAMVRLGLPGVPRTVVVDTANFTGNYPPECSVEAIAADGYPSPEELLADDWVTIVPRSPLRGDSRNEFTVVTEQRFTHVRLSIYPHGGVARLRVHGVPLPDPRELLDVPVDVAAMANGGRAVACSDSFFSKPDNMLQPGDSRFMSDGWETARRRDDGHDWAIVALAGQALPRVLELATTHYKGNSPERAALWGLDAGSDDAVPGPSASWFPLLPRTRLQPDTTHRFRLDPVKPVTHVMLDIHPDGGIARLRLYGRLTDHGWQDLTLRWLNGLPDARAAAVLTAAGLDAAAVLAARPLRTLPAELALG